MLMERISKCGMLLEPEPHMAQAAEIRTTHRWQALPGAVEVLLQRRPKLWMYALLAAGFAVRVWQASLTFLNPDEALHFLAANKTSWWLTYKPSLPVSHPPLLI